MSGYLTNDEKIDYIYKEMRSEKRGKIFKLLIQLLIIGSIVYFYFTFFSKLDKEEMIGVFSKNISKIVTPIAKDLTDEILKDATGNAVNANDVSNSLIEQLKNNPDLLNKLK